MGLFQDCNSWHPKGDGGFLHLKYPYKLLSLCSHQQWKKEKKARSPSEEQQQQQKSHIL
jgi:hypothetical protein